MSHKHLTVSEREKILIGKVEGKSITMIAESVGRNKSTVSRELKRNSDGHKYSSSKAQSNYEHRRLDCKRNLVLEDNCISSIVKESLENGWSPEQIVGRLGLEISVPTIYRSIKNGILPPQFKKCLHRKGKPYKYKCNGKETRGKLFHILRREAHVFDLEWNNIP